MRHVVVPFVGQIGRFRHHVGHSAAFEVRQLFILERRLERRDDLRLGTTGHHHLGAQILDRQYRTRSLGVQTHGVPHLRVPEFGPAKRHHPSSIHNADKTILAFNRCLVALPSQNQDRCVAGNGFGRRTSRQGYLRFPIRHQVLVDRGHLRIRCRGILCHRLVRRAEHNKQCEAFDYDCSNFIFTHNPPLENQSFHTGRRSACSGPSPPLTCRLLPAESRTRHRPAPVGWRREAKCRHFPGGTIISTSSVISTSFPTTRPPLSSVGLYVRPCTALREDITFDRFCSTTPTKLNAKVYANQLIRFQVSDRLFPFERVPACMNVSRSIFTVNCSSLPTIPAASLSPKSTCSSNDLIHAILDNRHRLESYRWLHSGFRLHIRFPGPHIDRNGNVRMCYEPHAVDLLQAIGEPNREIRLLPVLHGDHNMVNIVNVSNVSA